MGFRALFRGATSSAIPKEVSFDMSENSLPTLAEGEVYRSKRARVKALRGSWEKSSTSGKMESVTSSSSHPITMIDGLSQEVVMELSDIGQGIGAAFWITDQNNWWGLTAYQTAEDCNCSTVYYTCNCRTTYYSCNCSTYTYPSSYYTKYVCADRAPNGYCRSYYSYQAIAGYSSSYSCSTCSSYGCSTCSTQACSTCYPQFMRIIQSVAGSISTVTGFVIDNVIRSMKVWISKGSVTALTYSDANLQNVNSSTPNLLYDFPSGTSRTTNFGVILAPGSDNESKTLSSIKIRRIR
jgi:hypothetical protein